MLAEFAGLMNSVKTDLPDVEGCQDVSIYKNLSSSNMFTLVEKWETKKHHENHLARLSEDGTWEFISNHLSEAPESDYYVQL
jgi:quinol monooxygenase YgiN